MMTTYHNGNSLIKDNVRHILSSELTSGRKTIRVLSLPADNFFFEKMIEDMYPKKTFVFTCLEKNDNVYNRGLLRKSILRSRVEYLNCTTHEYLNKADARRKYDIIWLDYCGQYGQYVLDDLSKAKRLCHQDTVVGVTLMGMREQAKYTAKLRHLVDKQIVTLEHVRQISIPKLLSDAIGIPARKMIRYCDKIERSRAVPMYLYVLGKSETIDIPLLHMQARITHVPRVN